MKNKKILSLLSRNIHNEVKKYLTENHNDFIFLHHTVVFEEQSISFAPDFFDKNKKHFFFRYSFDVLVSYASKNFKGFSKMSNKEKKDSFMKFPKKEREQIIFIFNEVIKNIKFMINNFDLIIVEYQIFHNCLFLYSFLFKTEEELQIIIDKFPKILDVGHGLPIKAVSMNKVYHHSISMDDVNKRNLLKLYKKTYWTFINEYETNVNKKISEKIFSTLSSNSLNEYNKYINNNFLKGGSLKYDYAPIKTNRLLLRNYKDVYSFFPTWNTNPTFSKYNLYQIIKEMKSNDLLVISEHNNSLSLKTKNIMKNDFFYQSIKIPKKTGEKKYIFNGKKIFILFNKKTPTRFLFKNNELMSISHKIYCDISSIYWDARILSNAPVQIVNLNKKNNEKIEEFNSNFQKISKKDIIPYSFTKTEEFGTIFMENIKKIIY